MSAAPTILALSSPPGRSARAILRLSGPAVGRLLAERFGVAPRAGAHTGLLALSETASLPVLLAFFPAPRSYTGEDLLEVQLPGNPMLVERISTLFLAAGDIRPAEPGEFTARAFLNHRLTLDQAEGVALAIAAEGESDLAAARRLASGQTGTLYRAWSDELAMLLALVEAGIDFTDQEDVVPIPAPALSARLEALAGDITTRLGARRGRESGSALPLVALVGAPNAGKSTLFNALLSRRRAVTSPIAGTTRDVLAEPLDLSRDAPGAGPVMLVDLAGIDRGTGGSSDRFRDTVANPRENTPPSDPFTDSVDAPIDVRAQSIALSTLARADLLMYCDPTALFTPIPGVAAPTLRIRTKADLAAPSAPPASHSVPDQRPHAKILPVCALDGRNLAALRRHIALAIRGSTAGAEAILAPRHRLALALAADRLADAIRSIGPTRGPNLRPNLGPALGAPELTAGLLREALDSLGELTGRISPDDIIGRVFSTFCIGK